MRVGVIGAGTIAQWAHIPGYQKVSGVEVVAISEIDAARAKEVSAKWGIAHTFADYHEMLTLGLDAVSVCLPNYLHAEATVAALEAGCHVLCEKPMAMNAGEAEQMIAAAKRAGKVLMIGFNNRYRNDTMALKTLIGKGVFGQIYFGRAGWQRRRGIPGHGNWFTTKSKSGGGALIDIGVHALDLALWLMGQPKPVMVLGSTYAKFGPHGRGLGGWGQRLPGGPFDVDDLACAMLRFANGATLMLEASWASHVERDEMFLQLLGTESGARIVGSPPQTRVFTDRDGILQDTALMTPENPPASAHFAEVADFVRCIREGVAPPITGADGLYVMRILDAIYQSAATGQAVTM